MRFGEIVKKAWRVTWTYRMLWVLGLFAGTTGSTFSSPGFNSGRSSSGAFNRSDLPGRLSDPAYLADQVRNLLPVFLVLFGLLVIVGIAMAVLSIGARGGLVWAVNEIEEGRVPKLSQAWDAGFGRFWSVLGLGLLLQLPLALAWIAWLAVVAVPVLAAIRTGENAGAGALIASACGVLAIGLPILIIASFIIGIMYLTGLRFVMLYRMGAVDGAREAWRAFRARIGDHVLMSLLTGFLNTISGLVVALPLIAIAIALAIPGGLSLRAGNTGNAIVLFSIMGLLVLVLIFLYAAIWSTFTSALWTIFFRRLTGREPVYSAMPVGSMPFPTPPGQAQPWGPPQPPAYPAPSGYPPPPQAVPQPGPAWQPPPPPMASTPPAYPAPDSAPAAPPAPPMAPQPDSEGQSTAGEPEPPMAEPGPPNE